MATLDRDPQLRGDADRAEPVGLKPYPLIAAHAAGVPTTTSSDLARLIAT